MKHTKLWVGMAAGIVLFLVGLALIQLLPVLLAALVPIACAGALYLMVRLVRAVERIADALEQQQEAPVTGPSTESAQ